MKNLHSNTSGEAPETYRSKSFILGFCNCDCGREINIKQTGQNYLKRFATHHQKRGKDSPYWKNGKYIDGEGYVRILCPDHPYANNNGRVREHRIVMETFLGRYLKPHEKIHHINGIKTDNRIDNLQLYTTQKEHFEYHKIDMSKRICVLCKANKTRIHTIRPRPMWFYYNKIKKAEAGFICSTCYDSRRYDFKRKKVKK